VSMHNVLTQARSMVENGWAKGHYTDGLGAYCLAGAINIAAGEMSDLNGAIVYTHCPLAVKKLALDARVHVSECLPSPFISIPQFNDDTYTTREDVLAVLDKAISAC
jgi:hypothetical protein